MEYKKMPLSENVEEMFIGPFGSSLKNECFVAHEHAYCMVYEQKHAIQKTMNIETRYVDEKKYKELQRFNVKGGDIIVSCRGTIGETFVVPEEAPLGIMHPSIMKIRLKNGVYDRYYFNSLLKMRLKKHEAEANGSGIKMAISATELGKELFPVPSLVEQERIKEILSGVEALISKGKEELQLLDNLIKARFVELFGDLASPKCNWNKEKLVDTCVNPDDIKCGPFGTQLSKDEYVDSGIAVWEIPQINSSFSTAPTHYLTEEKAKQLDAYSIKPGDIAMSRKGNVGKCAVFPSNLADGIIHSDVLRIRLDANRVLPVFMMHQLHYSGAVQHQIELVSSGAIMAGINVTKLKQIFVHIPPLDLQNQFNDFVEQIDKSKFNDMITEDYYSRENSRCRNNVFSEYMYYIGAYVKKLV